MADLETGGMVKKYHVALFLNKGTPAVPDWMRIKKSTDNTITMNAETRDLDFISDESPTTVIDKYKPSLSQPVTMFKGEPDYEFLFDKFYNQAAGDNAKTECLIVFYGAKNGDVYKAWKCDALMVFDNMNPSESTMTVTINFNGTTVKGSAAISSGVPVFTADSVTEFTFTVNVSYDAAVVAGANVQIDSVRRTTNADGNAVFTLINGKTYALAAWDSDGHEYADVLTASSSTTSADITLV